jgi:hypothetical protein
MIERNIAVARSSGISQATGRASAAHSAVKLIRIIQGVIARKAFAQRYSARMHSAHVLRASGVMSKCHLADAPFDRLFRFPLLRATDERFAVVVRFHWRALGVATAW